MFTFSPISYFSLHYFKVSVNKSHLPFPPGAQRDAVSSVCTVGWRRKGSCAILSILPHGLENPFPRHIALWGLLEKVWRKFLFRYLHWCTKVSTKQQLILWNRTRGSKGRGRAFLGLYSSSAE